MFNGFQVIKNLNVKKKTQKNKKKRGFSRPNDYNIPTFESFKIRFYYANQAQG